MSENAIANTAAFTGHAKIIVLNLSKNKMTSCEGIQHLTALEELNLSENEIANTLDLKNLPNLKKLDMNTNKLTTMQALPSLPCLVDLDVSTNQIAKPDSISDLAQFKKLTKFNMGGNPVAEELPNLKQEVLFRLYPGIKIKMMGEDEVTEEDLETWKAERKDRLKAAAEAEKAKAEAERLAAERKARGEEEPKEGEEGEEAEAAE